MFASNSAGTRGRSMGCGEARQVDGEGEYKRAEEGGRGRSPTEAEVIPVLDASGRGIPVGAPNAGTPQVIPAGATAGDNPRLDRLILARYHTAAR